MADPYNPYAVTQTNATQQTAPTYTPDFNALKPMDPSPYSYQMYSPEEWVNMGAENRYNLRSKLSGEAFSKVNTLLNPDQQALIASQNTAWNPNATFASKAPYTVDQWVGLGAEGRDRARNMMNAAEFDAQMRLWEGNSQAHQQVLKENQAYRLTNPGFEITPYKDKTVMPATTSSNPTAGMFNSQVDASQETIEGRMGNLLGRDERGGFTNPVVRQAAERALAAFAGRGLLNSSMSQEAVMEAAIAKAIEIAGPDAERYFQNRRENVNWTNKFAQDYQNQQFNLQNMAVSQQYAKELKTLDQAFQSQNLDRQYANQLQTNYLQSMTRFEEQYNQAILAVQGSEMNQQDKASAIQTLQIQKENNILFTTEAFSMMPQWKNDWSRLTGGVGALQEAPQGINVAAGPDNASRTQIYQAIQYAAEDPSYMTDDQFKMWAQAAVNKGLISQQAYQQLIG